jgi:prepilin-type processing-associated H-X9-DG protein
MKSLARVFLCVLFSSLAGGSAFGQYANHVVISEIYGGGGNAGATFKNDFIELYNPTCSPVSLAGWSVQYTSAVGSSWQVTPLVGSIPAFGFYLIQEAQGTGGMVDLPTPDAVGSMAMSASAGKVALVNTTTALTGSSPLPITVVDHVGFGANANWFEGTASAPSPSNILSIARKESAAGLGNAYDTDDNASDFITCSPQPQNSSSPVEIDPTPHPVTLPRMMCGAGSDMTIAWTEPAGKSDGVIVLMRSSAPVATTVPSVAFEAVPDATSEFTAAADAGSAGFGSAGDKLVYKGAGASVTVTGLVNKTTYHVSILTASGAAWSAGVVRSETALPVELVSFAACVRGRTVELAWSTACEVNNAGFVIEKRTPDGAWRNIAFVDGHGTVSAPQHYVYIDACESGEFLYRLKQIDCDGNYEYSRQVEASIGMTATEYSLGQNYPNPFNPVTTIRFGVTSAQHVKLVVFNTLGQKVKTLFDDVAREHTLYRIACDGSALPSGTYFYMLQTADRREMRKMTLMK